MTDQAKPSCKQQTGLTPQPFAAGRHAAPAAPDIRRQLGWGLVQSLHKGVLR